MRIAILGAGGTIAPAIIRDLAESDEVTGLTLLDIDGERARLAAERHGAGKATAMTLDASDPQSLVLALEHHGLLLNAASYRVNLTAMDACLAARVGYLDLGGLYHETVKQLRLHDAFAERGLLAVLGTGAGPGKTNVMAAHAARGLDEVIEVRTSSAGLDLDPPAGFSTPYAVETLIDELTISPMVCRGGVQQPIDPLTDGGEIPFPDPIGRRGSLYTLHSEVLTLPGSLGASESDFRLSLSPKVHAGLMELIDLPREELRAIRPEPPSARTYSGQHVLVRGRRDGEPVRVEVTALTSPNEAWGLGGGIISTASCAAAAARLYARGELRATGALPPEQVLTPELLFPELEARGCVFQTTTVPDEAPTPSEVP